MDFDFFKNALKYNGTVTIFSVVVLYLVRPIFENVEFISNHPTIIAILFIIVINALLLTIFWTSKNKKNNDSTGIKGNNIVGNKAKNINILSNGEISGNTINDNESDGDLNIGQGLKNEKR